MLSGIISCFMLQLDLLKKIITTKIGMQKLLDLDLRFMCFPSVRDLVEERTRQRHVADLVA
jgi:hypothetical protein